MKRQKFPRGTRVRVVDTMPPSMRHFPVGFEAIVEYTYSQKYWGDDYKSYCLVMLDDNGNPHNSTAWYDESQLTLVSDNIEEGLRLIEKYYYEEVE